MAKPKVAFYWCSSCGGCEEAVVDLNEKILDVVDAVDIVFWPVALDFKYSDVENMDDGEIDVCFINGAVRTEEQEEIVKLLRQKSKLVFAFGSCAHLGGIPGLGNFWNREAIFERAYVETPTTHNPDRVFPQTETRAKLSDGSEVTLTLPEFYDTVNSLDQVIDVDYYLPGCPPPVELIAAGVEAILSGTLPPKGSVLGEKKSLCDSCKRIETEPERLSIREIKRPHEVIVDPDKCFLEQGIICLGPATRGGCTSPCIDANMPCRGCFGPVDGVEDQGSKMVSLLASILCVDEEEGMSEEEVKQVIDQIVDPAGTFYRFSLPASILKRKVEGG